MTARFSHPIYNALTKENCPKLNQGETCIYVHIRTICTQRTSAYNLLRQRLGRFCEWLRTSLEKWTWVSIHSLLCSTEKFIIINRRDVMNDNVRMPFSLIRINVIRPTSTSTPIRLLYRILLHQISTSSQIFPANRFFAFSSNPVVHWMDVPWRSVQRIRWISSSDNTTGLMSRLRAIDIICWTLTIFAIEFWSRFESCSFSSFEPNFLFSLIPLHLVQSA